MTKEEAIELVHEASVHIKDENSGKPSASIIYTWKVIDIIKIIYSKDK